MEKMKNLLYKFLTTLLITMIASCESYQIHGDLDGFWQVQSIENRETGETTNCNGDIYYSFQRELVMLSYVSPEMPKGQMKENHIAYFSHEDGQIAMTEFRIYLDKNGKPSPLPKLEKFGIYSTYSIFHVENLDSKSLILKSEKARIVFRKY